MGDEQKNPAFEESDSAVSENTENAEGIEKNATPQINAEPLQEAKPLQYNGVGYSWDNESRQTSQYIPKNEEEASKTESEQATEQSASEQLLNNTIEEGQTAVKKEKRKNRTLYTSTIITMAVVIVSIAVYIIIYASFFQTSLKGAWLNSEIDEITSENIFLVFDDDNEAYMSYGNIKYLGTYDTSVDDDGNKILSVDIPYAVQADFIYNFTDENTITLQMEGDSNVYTYKNVEIPDSALEVPEDYKIDENLYGTWLEPQYNITYTFYEGNRMCLNEGGLIEADCIYNVNVEDGVIHIEYFAGSTYTTDMEYSLEGNNLTIENMSFIKTADANGNPIETESSNYVDYTDSTASEETNAA